MLRIVIEHEFSLDLNLLTNHYFALYVFVDPLIECVQGFFCNLFGLPYSLCNLLTLQYVNQDDQVTLVSFLNFYSLKTLEEQRSPSYSWGTYKLDC